MDQELHIDFNDARLAHRLPARTTATRAGIVEYFDVGSGPVVVALHGAMGGCDQSLLLAQTIGAPGYRYLCLSRPGYLGTPLAGGGSPAQQADLVAALLEALGIDDALLVAISGGGPCAVQFGLRHPQQTRALVLVSTCATALDTKIPFSFRLMTRLARWPWFVARIRRKAADDLEAVARRSIRDPRILAGVINDGETWPLFSAVLLATFERMAQRLDGTRNDIGISRATTYPLEELSVPVLVVHGTEDRMVPFAAHAQSYASRLPDVELLAVEGGEHVAIFTHRALVRARVGEFMRRHAAPGTHRASRRAQGE